MRVPDLLNLAQSTEGPIRLFTGEPPPPTHPILPLWLGLTIIAIVLAGAIATWLLIDHSERIDRNPAEYAFRALSRRLRIPPRHAALLRKLANVAHTTPVALLVSDHALEAAALVFEKTNPPKRHLAALKQLRA